MTTAIPKISLLQTQPYTAQTINGITYYPIIDRATGNPMWAQHSDTTAANYVAPGPFSSGMNFYNSIQTQASASGVDPYTATKPSAALTQLTNTIQKGLNADANGNVPTFTPPALSSQPVAPTQSAAPLQYTSVTNIDPTTGKTYTTQYQTTDPYSSGYIKPSDLALTQQQAASNQTAYQTTQSQQSQQTQAVAAAQQAAAQQAAAVQAQIAAKQQAMAQQTTAPAAPLQYIPNPDPSSIDGTMVNGQNMIQTSDPYSAGYVTDNMLQSGIQNAAADAAAAAQFVQPAQSNSAGFDISINGIANAINKAGAQIGSFVDNHIPGGWATVGVAALLAVGVTNPSLLSSASNGTLTADELTSAGVNPTTVSSDIANGVSSGTIPPSSVGLADAPAISPTGDITTTALNGTNTVSTAAGDVTTTTAQGASTASTASEIAPVTPPNTIATTLPDGSIGAYDPATGTVYNADGTINAAATNAAPTPGAGYQVASNAPVAPGTGAATTAVEPAAATTTAPATSINPITNYVNGLSLGPITSGALAGAGTNAAIDIATGKPITASGLLTGAATGGIASSIGTFLPAAGTSAFQAGVNGAVAAAGANAIVDVATGKPITAENLATQALIGGAIGAGATAITNTGGGDTTYTWDDGSQMTVNNSGTPINVTNSSGAVLSLGTQINGNGPVVDNSTGQAIETPTTVPPGEIPATTATNPAGIVDNGNGTSTQTWDDGSTLTIDNTTGNPVSTVDTSGSVTGPSVPKNEIPATTATKPAGIVDNGNGTSTQTWDDGSTLTTDNTTGDVINTTAATDLTNPETNSLTSNQTSAITAAGATAAQAVAPATAMATTTGNQFLPIPTFTGQALVNPGINPGFIEPTPAYGAQPPGIDQYYWGQQGANAPAAPATPYGQTSNLGQLITPEQLGYPTPNVMNDYGLTAAPIPSQDIYHNTVQMNTAAPATPGIPQSYGPVVPAQSATGTGPGAIAGQNLNYVNTPPQLSGTPSAGLVAPGTFTAISPNDLAAQLNAQATAAGLAAQGTK